LNIFKELRQIKHEEDEILYLLKHRLSTIRIRFYKRHKGDFMAQTDPITLTVGSSVVATVVGFDQNGQPFTGAIPTPTWSIDNSSFDSITADTVNPADEDITSLAVGVGNLTATVQGVAGPLTDTEAITNVIPQVLTSIQIQFKAPAAPALKKA